MHRESTGPKLSLSWVMVFASLARVVLLFTCIVHLVQHSTLRTQMSRYNCEVRAGSPPHIAPVGARLGRTCYTLEAATALRARERLLRALGFSGYFGILKSDSSCNLTPGCLGTTYGAGVLKGDDMIRHVSKCADVALTQPSSPCSL